MASSTTPTVLIVRDGWGRNPHPDHHAWNAIELANTPVADRLSANHPSTLIKTSGEDVGLPVGTMGNSEVGHQNIGAGRVVDQEIMRITRALRDGRFFDNPALRSAFDHARRTQGKVHFLGLVSDGLVHSDIAHLLGLIELAGRFSWPAERLVVHAITDGRDTGPRTGLGFVETVERALVDAGFPPIATVMGRFWAMDRDHRWERVARAYAGLTGLPITFAERDCSIRRAASATEALRQFYDQSEGTSQAGDEFVVPTVIGDDEGVTKTRIHTGDAVIFFNFRGDRPREITRAFVLDELSWKAVQGGGFDRQHPPRDVRWVTMTAYERDLPVSAVAFEKPPRMPAILGQVVADARLRQFRCAETEKYPHVTFFFNDYRDEPFEGEARALLPSPRDVATYDERPAMSAFAVRDAALGRLKAPDCESLLVVNFANPDMVGHTGKLPAVIEAVEVVDACVGALVEATRARGGHLIVTADHGNAEQTWDPVHRCPHTAHTTFDVPLHVVSPKNGGTSLRPGRLADIAPTILELMGLPQPPEMTGSSLLRRSTR